MASGALQGWGAVVVAAFALGCCLSGGCVCGCGVAAQALVALVRGSAVVDHLVLSKRGVFALPV